ncbi:hypothetical protein [Larkinella sp. C7]|uniref:hypothetical protein n=1 Tax=Larkinella sp. C7 TaxID=2576607 RepID=UPI00111124C5|nr:hypothetical protein [Larkinella sp. C7]
MDLKFKKPANAPQLSDAPEVEMPSHEPEDNPEKWYHRFYSLRVLMGLAIAFLAFWVLADWTGWTAARMRPGQIVYSNEMVQLWTAAYRLVFVISVAVAIIRLTIPILTEYWRQDASTAIDATTDFKKLTPQQRLWFSFAVLLAFCYLFVQLLLVKLPESLSVGP